MSYGNVGSLTPSRPAPPAPQRRATDNALASAGYNLSSSSSSTYAQSYSGIGGSPNRNSDVGASPGIVRSGTVTVKEDGFASFLWRPKWLALREHTLSMHKNEVRGRRTLISSTSLIIWRLLERACAERHSAERRIERREDRLEAILLAAREQGSAHVYLSQRRRRALWMARRYLPAKPSYGRQWSHRLHA